jgi:hypothetical protein
MYARIAVSGPRRLTSAQEILVKRDLGQILCGDDVILYVGDAPGVDFLALRYAQWHHVGIMQYSIKLSLPTRARYAERSTRMIRDSRHLATLHAWPNKPCPRALTPAKSWPANAAGSGTWGTIALAVGLGMPLVLHPLADLGLLPPWLPDAHLMQGGALEFS